MGTFLVMGVLAICLFLQWRRTVRDYLHYLSIATAFLLRIIISLALLWNVVFVVIWTVTVRRHHF